MSLGLASWKSVPPICCSVWRRRWEAGLRSDLCIGKRTAEAGTDGEALWLGPDGVEEGSGEGIRKKKKKKKREHMSVVVALWITSLNCPAPPCQLSRDPNANFIHGHLGTSWWVRGLGGHLQACFVGSLLFALKLTHCWHSN